jgi:hypothetical protein
VNVWCLEWGQRIRLASVVLPTCRGPPAKDHFLPEVRLDLHGGVALHALIVRVFRQEAKKLASIVST